MLKKIVCKYGKYGTIAVALMALMTREAFSDAPPFDYKVAIKKNWIVPKYKDERCVFQGANPVACWRLENTDNTNMKGRFIEGPQEYEPGETIWFYNYIPEEGYITYTFSKEEITGSDKRWSRMLCRLTEFPKDHVYLKSELRRCLETIGSAGYFDVVKYSL